MRTLVLILSSLAVAGFASAQQSPPAPPAAPKPKPAPKVKAPLDEWRERTLEASRAAMERAQEQAKAALERAREFQLEGQLHAMDEARAALEGARLEGKLFDLQFQMPAIPLVPPLPPVHFDFNWHEDEAPRAQGELNRIRPQQGSPEDSLYRAARQALNAGDYARAASLFQTFEQRFPRSRSAPGALYYQAFALYRSGSTDHLRTALQVLRTRQDKYPQAATDSDAATLRTRVYAALAARGDEQAAAAVRAASASGATCDEDEMEVRAEALNALVQIDPEGGAAAIKRVLARRDECSVRLRRRAVYLLARAGTEQATNDLLDVARTDPDPSVRSDAISILGRSSFAAVTPQRLVQLFNDSPEERTRRAVLSALRTRGDAESRRAIRSIIERTDVPEGVRAEAISSLAGSSFMWVEAAVRPVEVAAGVPVRPREVRGTSEHGLTEEDATFLRSFYGRTDSRALKSRIVSVLARNGGEANEQWLMALVRNPSEESSLRREALSRLKSSAISIEDLGKLYDGLSERELRRAVVSQLASREEPAAVDKLIDIAKTSTDPQVRNSAIQALTRKKDNPKAIAFIRELVEKP
ncbi:MAG: HEAT repeat domain-containing protein [Gemmatimonadales bacterium]